MRIRRQLLYFMLISKLRRIASSSLFALDKFLFFNMCKAVKFDDVCLKTNRERGFYIRNFYYFLYKSSPHINILICHHCFLLVYMGCVYLCKGNRKEYLH